MGTFTSSGESESSFVLTNGTFVGEGVCSGEGVFGLDGPSGNLTVLDGDSSVSGSGLFHFPQGLFNGTGKLQHFWHLEVYIDRFAAKLLGLSFYLNSAVQPAV